MNSVSTGEYIQIISTLHSVYEKQFNCYHCKRRYLARSDYEVMNNKIRKLMGCFGVQEEMKASVENIEYYSCPGNFTSPTYLGVIDLFMHFDKGVMPFEGAITDQPAKIIEIFNIMDSYKSQREKEEIERQQQSSRMKNGK